MTNICRICNKNIADKTNSHQLPSFLAAMINSNGSYKRGNELMFQYSNGIVNAYASGLNSTKWEELFDDLSDDRLKDLSKNPVSEDYVFCKDCENKLGKYLESPYASFYKESKNIDSDIALMFWISVVWRLSTQGTNGFSLEKSLENQLHDSLYEYFSLKETKGNIIEFIQTLNICYKLVVCKDYCRENAGTHICEYDETNKLLTILIGDICLCMCFEGYKFPLNYSFYGIEQHIIKAPQNNGLKTESHKNVDKTVFDLMTKNLGNEFAKRHINFIFNIIDYLWNRLGYPQNMPFILRIEFLCKLIDDKKKLGEKYTIHHIASCFYDFINNINPASYL